MVSERANLESNSIVMATENHSRVQRRLLLGAASLGAVSLFVPSALAKQKKALVTYSGLKVYEDGSSTLRVNLTRKVPVEFDQKGKRIVFLIQGAKIELKNNKNALRAEYFSSNVIKAKLDDSSEGARLEITLRSATPPTHQMIEHSGGAILRIDIPPVAQ